MKKLIMMFPSIDFVQRDRVSSQRVDKLNQIIKKRYISTRAGFKIVNIMHKCQKLLKIDAIKDAETLLVPEHKEFTRDALSELYAEIVTHLEINKEDMVNIGGFHLGDCTNWVANEIQKHSRNTLIDPAVTNGVFYHLADGLFRLTYPGPEYDVFKHYGSDDMEAPYYMRNFNVQALTDGSDGKFNEITERVECLRDLGIFDTCDLRHQTSLSTRGK
ncbi:MAG: hypothetical protein FWE31_02015 [Firmicutes bacterium]|nr:hypothetical protein [Bacillota bacterium]